MAWVSILLIWVTVIPVVLSGKTTVVWPTPSTAFMEGQGIEAFIQPTQSGIVESGTYGCVRSGGRQFHEALDIAPVQRTRSGEAADDVYAAMDGRVAYVRASNGYSSYGRYVVIEHVGERPAVYTLYAHLAKVREGLRKGQQVRAGDVLGTMGRSATSYSIPKSRAHLHFEVGLRLSDDFDAWFKGKKEFGSTNHHGDFSGLNLVGLDPLPFFEAFRAGRVASVEEYFSQELEAAFTLRVATARTPGFVRRYPSLVDGMLPAKGLRGWDVAFTECGVPVRWRPLTDPADALLHQPGNVSLIDYNEDALDACACRKLIDLAGDDPVPLRQMRRTIELLFGFR